MNYDLIRLSFLLSRFGEEAVAKKLETFVPPFKSANDSFLAKMSIVMEKRSECRTYIAFDSETSEIMGFFAIGFRCLEVSDDCGLSKSMLKKLNRSEDNIAQAYLLGQLSRAEGYPGFGKTLINEAISKIREAQEIVGCRVVRIDCTDELIGYYQEYGFYYVKKNLRKNLNQMIMLL